MMRTKSNPPGQTAGYTTGQTWAQMKAHVSIRQYSTGVRASQPFLILLLARALHLSDHHHDPAMREKFRRLAKHLRREMLQHG